MGLAHLYEHMIFKGTANRSASEIARVLEKSGGLLNAFTGKEHVCVYARCVAGEFDTACEVIRDLVENPLFDGTELKKERGVVLEEIRACGDDPEDRVHDLLMDCLWPGAPLGYPIAGTEKSVLGLNRADLLRMNRAIRSSKMVVAASGNVSHERLAAHFKGIASPGPARSLRRTNPGGCPMRRLIRRPIQQSNVALGFKGCCFPSEDRHALMVFNTLLGEGMSSRLFQKLREELGLAYSVYSFLDSFQDTGLFGVYLGTDPGKTVTAVREVLREIRSALEGGVAEKDLDFAKSFIRGNVLLAQESTVNRMMHLARTELYLGRVEPVEKALERIERVTLRELRRVCGRYLTPDNLSIAVVAPKGVLEPGTLKRINFE